MPDSSTISAQATAIDFSANQYQALVDLGIDAWYLQPLSRTDNDPEYQQQQTDIANIVDQLNELVDAPSFTAPSVVSPTISPAVPMTKTSLITTDGSGTSEGNSGNRTVTGSASVEQLPENAVQSIVRATTESLQSSQTLVKTSTSQVASPLSIAPIQLSTEIDLTPPNSGVIAFPDAYQGDIEPTAEGIATAITTLSRQTSMSDDNPVLPDDLNHTLTGIGSQGADWMIVIPPPMYRHLREKRLLLEQEQQLLTESLSSIGKTFDEIYITPLLKQGVYKQKDPNIALLTAHLPILAAEIAWVQPKRLMLLGHTPPQALLSTKAPLSQLMDCDYQLRLGELTLPISIMPSLHYFLAVPAEKSLLWQCLKKR